MMSDDENLTDDEEFMELALIIGFPRKRKTYLERPNHFIKWRDEQFFSRFRMSKNCVYFILDHIKENITSPTNRYSIQLLNYGNIWDKFHLTPTELLIFVRSTCFSF